MSAQNDHPVLGFGVTATVGRQTAHGPGGLDLRDGLRHFAPGARVWILPPQWGDGGTQIVVAGHHRGTRGRGYARMVIGRRHLTAFRARAIYSPALMRALAQPLPGRDHGPHTWETFEQARQAASYWNAFPLDTCTDDNRLLLSVPRVSDPPPLEIEHDQRTYYLAHFNAYRAVYSVRTPPAENPPPGHSP